jgi:hypothetical protein
LENLHDDDDDDDVDFRGNIKASATECPGYYEFKRHKVWFDDECSKLLIQRKQIKVQWLQNPKKTDGDNMNNGRRDTHRTIRR